MPRLLGTSTVIWQVNGGTISDVTNNGVLHRRHVFTSLGSLVVIGPKGIVQPQEVASLGLEVEYLLVGGGGGGAGTSGGGYAGGGGGGGGIRTGIMRLRPGSYPVVIGAGGSAGGSGSDNAGQGGSTTALGLTAAGGGGGGLANSGGTGFAGKSGASGGGGGSGPTAGGAAGAATPATTPPQGSAGQAGGTGGAGGHGGGVRTTTGGYMNGGQEPNNGVNIDWSGAWASFGNGRPYGAPSAGVANSGDGGQGQLTAGSGAAGGSGIFMIRYRI